MLVVNLSAAHELLLLPDTSAIAHLVCNDASGLLARSEPLSLAQQCLTDSITFLDNLRFNDERL